MTQITQEQEKGLELLSWENIKADAPQDAAFKALEKHFAEIRALSFVWVYVARPQDPKHSNGMPMIVESFKLKW